jgi:fructosamine-3-kinase
VGSEEWDYWRAMVPLHGESWESPARTRQLFEEGYESVRPLPSGLETRGRAYQAFVSVSYLDSLQTQRGIDDGTRPTAEFLRRHVSETLAELREDWVN